MSALTRGALGAVVWIGFMVGLAVIIGSPCDTETRNYCVSIVDDPDEPGGRTLVLDGLSHAFVDLDDPTNLRFGYIRRFADVTAATMASSDSLTVLHVGGGGFTFPRYLVAVAPASRHVVLELDPGIVDVARTRLGFSPSEQIGVVVGDARLSIASQPTDAFDLVAGDAFGGLAVPWHLTTREFLVEIDRVLRPGGVYVMNLIDAAPLRFVRAEARTARSVFGNVAIVGRPSAGTDVAPGNVVLVASQAPIDAAGIEARIASWAEPADTAVMSDPARVDAFIGDAAELTDDYAPVDQLLGR